MIYFSRVFVKKIGHFPKYLDKIYINVHQFQAFLVSEITICTSYIYTKMGIKSLCSLTARGGGGGGLSERVRYECKVFLRVP